jgi:hypothetical protein
MNAQNITYMIEKRLRSEIALPSKTVDAVLDILKPTIEAIAQENRTWDVMYEVS